MRKFVVSPSCPERTRLGCNPYDRAGWCVELLIADFFGPGIHHPAAIWPYATYDSDEAITAAEGRGAERR